MRDSRTHKRSSGSCALEALKTPNPRGLPTVLPSSIVWVSTSTIRPVSSLICASRTSKAVVRVARDTAAGAEADFLKLGDLVHTVPGQHRPEHRCARATSRRTRSRAQGARHDETIAAFLVVASIKQRISARAGRGAAVSAAVVASVRARPWRGLGRSRRGRWRSRPASSRLGSAGRP